MNAEEWAFLIDERYGYKEGFNSSWNFNQQESDIDEIKEILLKSSYQFNEDTDPETKHDAFTSGGDTTAQQRRYTYDANGNLTSSTNPAQEKTVYTYDPANRLVTTAVYASATSTQPLKTINYQINAQNQFIGYTQAAGTTPEGNPAPGLTPDILPLSETYTYTALNQVETVTVNLGGLSKTYAYTYYPNGLKHTYTNPEGITYTYYYNKNNQLTA